MSAMPEKVAAVECYVAGYNGGSAERRQLQVNGTFWAECFTVCFIHGSYLYMCLFGSAVDHANAQTVHIPSSNTSPLPLCLYIVDSADLGQRTRLEDAAFLFSLRAVKCQPLQSAIVIIME